jgi:hypothetical protein
MAAPERDPSEACVIGLNKDWAAECPAKMCAPNRGHRAPQAAATCTGAHGPSRPLLPRNMTKPRLGTAPGGTRLRSQPGRGP